MEPNEVYRRAVMRLASERPDWLPVLHAACVRASKSERFGGEFAGHWVLQELRDESGTTAWAPGLRLLVAYGLLEKSGPSTRGGRRSYYRMPNRLAIETALKEIASQSCLDTATTQLGGRRR